MVISAHAPPFEVMETVVEAADLAWNAFERCHGHKQSEAVHEQCAKLEAELARERSENQRLKAALEDYHKAILQLHKPRTASGDNCGDSVAYGIPQTLSENCPSDVLLNMFFKFSSSCEQKCIRNLHLTNKVLSYNSGGFWRLYEQLKNTVESPVFLAKLHNIHEIGKVTTEDPESVEVEGDILLNTNPEDPSWWLWVTDDIFSSKAEEQCGLDNEGYVIVTEEDIVEGIAIFMARCIVSNPQAEKMTPEQLQKTLSTAFASMNNRNVIKKLWNAGKFMYTAATWGIAVVGFYRHPYILRAAMKAVLASGRILVRAL